METGDLRFPSSESLQWNHAGTKQRLVHLPIPRTTGWMCTGARRETTLQICDRGYHEPLHAEDPEPVLGLHTQRLGTRTDSPNADAFTILGLHSQSTPSFTLGIGT